MRVKLLRRVRREACYAVQEISALGTENGRVVRIRYPIGRTWVYEWMLGERIDIYESEEDRMFAICKIARILWRRELRDYWIKKIGVTDGK